MPAEILNQPWVPQVLPILLARIGPLHLAAVPAEITVMAGRRLKKTIAAAGRNTTDQVIIASYANDYLSYVTTPEEYGMQHYEGASTLFGPWTLAGFQQEFSLLARELASGVSRLQPGAEALDLSHFYRDVRIPPAFDHPSPDTPYGRSLNPMESEYRRGYPVRAAFLAGHPRNGMDLDSFLHVQQWDADQRIWINIASDNDWDTRFYWYLQRGYGVAVVEWTPDPEQPAGTFRLLHRGKYRVADPQIREGLRKYYEGHSDSFVIP